MKYHRKNYLDNKENQACETELRREFRLENKVKGCYSSSLIREIKENKMCTQKTMIRNNSCGVLTDRTNTSREINVKKNRNLVELDSNKINN